jgi:hypothetical protein
MSTPRLVRILANLQSTLQGLAISDGYTYDVKVTSVVRRVRELTTIPPSEQPFIIVGWGSEGGPTCVREYQPAGRVLDTWRIPITIRADALGQGDGRIDEVYANLIADLEIALTGDCLTTRTSFSRGGNATETRLADSRIMSVGIEPNSLIVLEQLVEVRLPPRPISDPRT